MQREDCCIPTYTYIASLLTSPFGHRRSEGLPRPTRCLSRPRACMCTLIVNRIRQVRFLEVESLRIHLQKVRYLR